MKIRIIDGYKVKECPFCGKVSTIDFADLKTEEMCGNFDQEDLCPAYKDEECGCGVFVVCNYAKGGCGGSGAWALDKETAVKRWNRRGGDAK